MACSRHYDIWYVVKVFNNCLVGFGDYFPRSHVGRFIIIMTTFWGVFLVSMCIVSVSNYRKFYSTEKYVMNLKTLSIITGFQDSPPPQDATQIAELCSRFDRLYVSPLQREKKSRYY